MEESFAPIDNHSENISSSTHEIPMEGELGNLQPMAAEENFETAHERNPIGFSPLMDTANEDTHHPDSIGFKTNKSENGEIDKLQNDVTELKDKYVRLYAEFDNFKRRTSKERVDLFKTANRDVLVALLPILDDMERAQKSFQMATELGPIKEGVELIAAKFKNLMVNQGLTEIKAIGEKFDTDLHEAITNIPAPSENMKGKVIDEMEKGYKLGDKVIRFSKVIVGV